LSTVFHTSEPPWFDDVKDLKPGESRRINDADKVSFNGRGYHLWSFREKTSEVWSPQLTLAEKLANDKAMREREEAAAQSQSLPLPMMAHPQDWPSKARVWMHKADLSNPDILRMGAYWNPEMQRVVLPFMTLHGVSSWIARHVDWRSKTDGQKYLKPNGKQGGGAVYDPYQFGWGAVGRVDAAVLTEDTLSAYRVARDTGGTGVALNGTSLDRDAILSIARQFPAAVVWLDPDYYGQLGAKRVITQLQQLDVSVRNIVSEADPKNLSRDTLRAMLKGTNG
jgi:hypothetical protein